MATTESIYANVKAHYGTIASSSPFHGSAHASDEGANESLKTNRKIASAFGYTASELGAFSDEANLGLGCGNPIALASLKEGETVVDLGCGGGFDCFLAADKVAMEDGEMGRVIGVDFNKDMLARANKTKARYGEKYANVEFVEGELTRLPLESGVVDCAISNCVVNLVPEEEKQKVFNEMFRVLKPGGRVAISDILTKKPLTEEMRENVALYVGCISGASMKEAYERYFRHAGFHDVMIVDTESDLNVYTTAASVEKENGTRLCCAKIDEPSISKDGEEKEENKKSCCGPSKKFGNEADVKKKQIPVLDTGSVANLDLNEWAASYKIFALKP